MDTQYDLNIIARTGTKSYSSKEWELQRTTICELYQQGLRQKELLEILGKKHGFHPTYVQTLCLSLPLLRQAYTGLSSPSMLKKRIHKWSIDRKNKEKDIIAALRISLSRRSIGKRTSFRIRGRIIDENEINRYLRRKGIQDAAELAESSTQADSSVVRPFTPSLSPGPEGDAHLGKEREIDPASAYDHSCSQEHCNSGDSWHTATTQALESNTPWQGYDHNTYHHTSNVAGLLHLSITEQLLLLNDAFHKTAVQVVSYGSPKSIATSTHQANTGIDRLRAFTNGMWRGRGRLLESQCPSAFRSFNDALDSLPPLLSNPHEQLLTDVYEMILNFQLDKSKDILYNVLKHAAEVCEARNNTDTNSRRVGIIAKALSLMSFSDRAAIAECLIRNVRDHYRQRQSSDAQEAKSIDKILSRSLYRRKEISQAIAYLEDKLQNYSPLGAVDLSDSCTMLVELAQCYRFQKQHNKAIQCARLALQRAQNLSDPYGYVDIKVRCIRTFALSEAKRGNYHLSHQYATRALVLGDTYLGPEGSLTSLIRAEVEDIELILDNLGLDHSSPSMDSEAAFWLPLDNALATCPVDQPLILSEQNYVGQAGYEQSDNWLGS
jgi:tetratricopeptide (TPR) repeat protein